MTEENKPSFAIMGTGGIGGCFGAALADAGYPVHFIARGAHLDAIRQNGLRIERTDGPLVVKAPATDDPAEVGPVDYVLFGVKLWDTEDAAEKCRPMLKDGTAVISLQNGVTAPDILTRVLGSEHVLGGVAEISAYIDGPGVVRRMSPGQVMRFGELDNSVTDRVNRLDAALRASDTRSNIAPDIWVTMWEKFIFITGLSAMTALTRKTLGEIREDEDTRALLRQIMEEVETVARAKGVDLPADVMEERMGLADKLPYKMRASMANDLMSGIRLELPWLSGGVVELGREAGVPTPANAFVYTALKLHAGGAT